MRENISSMLINILKRITLQAGVIALVFSLTIFLFLLDWNRMYRSNVSIIIIPKSSIASEQIDSITANAIAFPKMLSFYNRLVSDNQNIIDPTAGKNPDERKKIWNNFVEVTHSNNKDQNIIDISVLANKQADADILSKKTAQTLFSTMSAYYNIKDDLDMRIIEGPISKAVVNNWLLLAFFSVAFGTTIAYGIELMTNRIRLASFFTGSSQLKESLKKINDSFANAKNKPISALNDLYLPEEKNEIAIVESETVAIPEASVLQKEKETPIPEIKKAQYPNFPEMPVKQVSQAIAPDNLPIMDEAAFRESMRVIEPVAESEGSSMQQTVSQSEPTPEDIKKRLNDLLKGGK